MSRTNRTAVERRLDVNGVEIAWFEWAGEGPPLVFCHATGFHARCWDAVIERLPGRRCIAIDLRGHGRSAKPPPPYPWTAVGGDVSAVLRAIGVRHGIGVGHSGGGYAIMRGTADAPEAFERLLLVDPVVPARSRPPMPPGAEREHFAAKRRNRWSSPEEMFERFKDRMPYSLWREDVLRDYCRYGLSPAPDGNGYVLACPPEVEAAMYAGIVDPEIDDVIAALTLPVTVLRARTRTAEMDAAARRDMSTSPTPPDLATRLASAEDVFLPHLSHFIPMEAPEVVASYLTPA